MADIEGERPRATVGSDAGDVTAQEVTIRQGGARSIAALSWARAAPRPWRGGRKRRGGQPR